MPKAIVHASQVGNKVKQRDTQAYGTFVSLHAKFITYVVNHGGESLLVKLVPLLLSFKAGTRLLIAVSDLLVQQCKEQVPAAIILTAVDENKPHILHTLSCEMLLADKVNAAARITGALHTLAAREEGRAVGEVAEMMVPGIVRAVDAGAARQVAAVFKQLYEDYPEKSGLRGMLIVEMANVGREDAAGMVGIQTVQLHGGSAAVVDASCAATKLGHLSQVAQVCNALGLEATRDPTLYGQLVQVMADTNVKAVKDGYSENVSKVTKMLLDVHHQSQLLNDVATRMVEMGESEVLAEVGLAAPAAGEGGLPIELGVNMVKGGKGEEAVAVGGEVVKKGLGEVKEHVEKVWQQVTGRKEK
jgi:hypothetical protein